MTTVQNQGNQQFQKAAPLQVLNSGAQNVHPQIAPAIQTPQALPAQNYATTPQVQPTNPNYAGVNIQIYNPSVGVPNINPTGNIPQSQSVPGIAYPANYYTHQFVPQNAGTPSSIVAQGGQGGNANIYNTVPPAQTTSNELKAAASDANIGSDTKNSTDKAEQKKTEKRKVVELSDDYIKNLENYLNSQDKEVRMMGAKEVVARLQEDDSRKDDPALTALVNKMLQDPSQQVRFLALSMLDSRTCTGDDYTIGVLKKMQNGTSGYGQDAAQATNILLKMSGKLVDKEFEVKDKSDKK